MQKLMDDITAWADATFPNQNVLGKLSHLIDEVQELQDAIDDEDSTKIFRAAHIQEELADCFILLLNVAKNLGYSVAGIKLGIENKMEINKKRKWGKVGKNGQIYHQ